MLDALSGGRLELGVGRGISPIELRMMGVDPDEAQALFAERLEILLRGLSSDRLDLEESPRVPMELRPVQRPASAALVRTRAGGVGAPRRSRRDERGLQRHGRRRCAWSPTRTATSGSARAATRASCRCSAVPITWSSPTPTRRRWTSCARPTGSGSRAWTTSGSAHGVRVPLPLPDDPDEALAAGSCVAGSPATVRDRLLDESERAGVSYLLGRFAFGDLPLDASLRSVELFCAEVAPAFAAITPDNRREKPCQRPPHHLRLRPLHARGDPRRAHARRRAARHRPRRVPGALRRLGRRPLRRRAGDAQGLRDASRRRTGRSSIRRRSGPTSC